MTAGGFPKCIKLDCYAVFMHCLRFYTNMPAVVMNMSGLVSLVVSSRPFEPDDLNSSPAHWI